jgi:hypothetical protein
VFHLLTFCLYIVVAHVLSGVASARDAHSLLAQLYYNQRNPNPAAAHAHGSSLSMFFS